MSGRPLAQSSPTECGVSACDCDHEASTMRKPWPIRDCRTAIIIIIIFIFITFMEGNYNYVPETNHVSRIYSTAAVQY